MTSLFPTNGMWGVGSKDSVVFLAKIWTVASQTGCRGHVTLTRVNSLAKVATNTASAGRLQWIFWPKTRTAPQEPYGDSFDFSVLGRFTAECSATNSSDH